MNKMLLLLLISLIFSNINILAEDFTNKVELLKISERHKALQSKEKMEAESKAKTYGLPIKQTMPDSSYIEIAKWSEGKAPLYYIINNLVAAKTVSTNKVWPSGGIYNLTGKGITLWEWDAGAPRTTHQEYNNGGVCRVTVKDGSSAHFHSAHVAGTMIGAGVKSDAIGMSYEAKLNNYDWNSDATEMSSDAANLSMRISNHSYGYITGWYYNYLGDNLWVWFGDPTVNEYEDYTWGYYDQTCADWDEIANNAPHYLICKSAGNDRKKGPSAGTEHWVWKNGAWEKSTTVREINGGSDEYDCISYNGLAKNILTVAAVNDISAGYSNASDVVMTSFSSWGPCDDGRIKPDISANGVGLYSSYHDGDANYASLNGTSMACPNVAGSVGLMLQHRNNLVGTGNDYLSSTIKGIIIGTADEAGSYDGPDYAFGWGLLNTKKCIDLMSQNSEYSSDYLIQENELSNGETEEIKGRIKTATDIRVTIVWNDPKGTPKTTNLLNNRNPLLVNDLDLRIFKGTSEYKPWILDPANPATAATTGDNKVDNVEQVYIKNASAGDYSIKVSHKGTLAKNQKYSLIINGLHSMSPDHVHLSAPANNSEGITIVPKFDWTDAEYFETYNIMVSKDANFTNIVKNDENVQMSYYETKLDYNTKYYWKVRSKEGNNYSTWSEVFSFTTASGTNTYQAKIVGIKALFENITFKDANVKIPISIELRSGSNLATSTIVSSKQTTIDSTAYSEVDFSDTQDGSYWLVVRAAGYLPAGSTSKISISTSQKASYDFTQNSSNIAGGSEAVSYFNNKYFIRYGDFNYDRQVNASDIDIIKILLGNKNNNYVPLNK